MTYTFGRCARVEESRVTFGSADKGHWGLCEGGRKEVGGYACCTSCCLGYKERRTLVQMAQWRTLYTQFKCYHKTIIQPFVTAIPK